jgi:hypothetical protein
MGSYPAQELSWLKAAYKEEVRLRSSLCLAVNACRTSMLTCAVTVAHVPRRGEAAVISNYFSMAFGSGFCADPA